MAMHPGLPTDDQQDAAAEAFYGVEVEHGAGATLARQLSHLERLVMDLQRHAREHGWQDVDDPIAALLEWRQRDESTGECAGCGCSRWACDSYRTSGKVCCPDCSHGKQGSQVQGVLR